MHIILILLVILSVVGCVAIFIGWIAEGIYHAVALTYKVTKMKGAVLEKCRRSNVALQVATDTYPWGPYYRYYVYIWIDGRRIELENRALYYKVEVGDVIEIDVHKGYNKNGKMCHEFFEVV